MQAYDLIMLIVLAMATIFGAIKGFAWQIASLASIVVSYFVAYRFRYDVADMIQAKPPWNLFLAMLILYVGTSFVIWVAFRLLSGAIDKVRLKEFDRQLGAGFGFAKGLIYCLLITMFAMSLLGPNQQKAICDSRSGFYISKALDHGIGVLPQEIHDVVHPYLARLDDKLKNGGEATEGESGGWPNLNAENLGGALEQLPSLPGFNPASSGSGNGGAGSSIPSLPTNLPDFNSQGIGGGLLPPLGSQGNSSGGNSGTQSAEGGLLLPPPVR